MSMPPSGLAAWTSERPSRDSTESHPERRAVIPPSWSDQFPRRRFHGDPDQQRPGVPRRNPTVLIWSIPPLASWTISTRSSASSSRNPTVLIWSISTLEITDSAKTGFYVWSQSHRTHLVKQTW